MSHRALVHVCQYPADHWSTVTRMVAILVAEHINDADGTAWPSDRRIARLGGLSVKSVQRALSQLEADGAIVRSTDPFKGGGRRRVIEWRYWPVGPGLRLVDNATGTVAE